MRLFTRFARGNWPMTGMVLLAVLVVMGAAHVAMAAAPSTDYVVYPLAEGQTSNTLVVPDDGIVTLWLSRSGEAPATPETLEVALTTLVDGRGRSVPAALLLGVETPQSPPVRPSGTRT